MTNINKEYIKNLIKRNLKGKIGQAESKEIENTLLNLSKEEWKSLKIIGKDIVKEQIEQKINEIVENFGLQSNVREWESETKNFLHSLVNLIFALVNEDMIYESMQLIKKSGIQNNNLSSEQYLQLQQKATTEIIIPQLIVQLNRISSRKPARNIKDYYQAEVGFLKKVNRVMSLVKRIKGKEKVNERQTALEFIKILKNVTVDEIRVGKDRLKLWAGWWIDLQAKTEIAKHPELKQFAQTLLNFLDAVYDEEIIKESWSLVIEIAEKMIQQIDQNEPDLGRLFMIQDPALIARCKNLLVKVTNHFNQLASEEVNNNNLSTQAETAISQRISNIQTRDNQDENNLPVNSPNALNLLTGEPNTLINSLGGNPANSPSSRGKFLEMILADLKKTRSKPKWYKNPWFIWPTVLGFLALGILVIRFFVRRKKTNKITS